mgnify:FL=1
MSPRFFDGPLIGIKGLRSILMKYIALLFLFCSEIADASFPGTGIGLTLGAPSGFSGRTPLSENESLGFGAGWSIVQNHHFEFFGDYLWNRPDAFEINGEKFDFFFGGFV